jgi:hypothetical protein
MKRSTEIYTELQATLAKIRSLNADADACRPITRQWRLSQAENAENERRATKLDQILAALRKAEIEARDLRKDYSAAMVAEQVPQVQAAPAKSVSEISKLQKQINEAEASLAELPEQRRPHVVAASRGDRKAVAALDQIATAENSALNRIDIAKSAIAEIETQAAEERREFLERDADSRFAAAQSAAAEVTAHDHATDLMMRALAEHLAKRPALLRAVRKSGCEIDDARMNVLATVEILHRAAKAAGLADILQISIRDAASLKDASRTLLKLAIRRPTIIERKVA